MHKQMIWQINATKLTHKFITTKRGIFQNCLELKAQGTIITFILKMVKVDLNQ